MSTQIIFWGTFVSIAVGTVLIMAIVFFDEGTKQSDFLQRCLTAVFVGWMGTLLLGILVSSCPLD